MTNANWNKIILKNKNTVNISLPLEKLFDINTAKSRGINKYNKGKVDKLIYIDNINEELYKIEESEYDYITTSGNVYVHYGNGLFYHRAVHINQHNGYIYVNISKKDKNVQRRLHVLLANTFIPNPYHTHLKIVGHKNDDKSDYRLENLYWTNNQENTQDAITKGFNYQNKAENNNNSMYVKVLDKNTLHIVGVYGSIRECARCIKNTSVTMIAKMCKKGKIYKPRSRKYIYLPASKNDFEENCCLQNISLEESLPTDKSPKIFLLCNDKLKYKKEFDNQVQASNVCNIKQAIISRMIKTGEVVGGWYCVYIGSTEYTKSSSYQNLIQTIRTIVLENIYTKEIIKFSTAEELKKHLGLVGHDITQYIKNDHVLMNEWKVIDIEDKTNKSIIAS